MIQTNSEKDQDDFLNRVKTATEGKKKESPIPKGFSEMKGAGLEETIYGLDDTETKQEKRKTKIRYESIRLERNNFPYIAKKKIGEECIIVCRIRKISESLPDFYDNDKKPKVKIEILKISEPKSKG